MNKDRIKGMIDEVAGSAMREVGELTDNSTLQLEGMVKQVKGKAENAWGKTRDAAHDAIKNTQVHPDVRVALKAKNATPDAESSKHK
jgi:uncharacterized protein YjbJ (UPF0337 family)